MSKGGKGYFDQVTGGLEFNVALANWVGETPGLCIHSETCCLALALEHTGDLYSCDHFVEPGYKLGNIRMTHMLELVASAQQQQSGSTSARRCRVTASSAKYGHGGCSKDRFTTTPEGEPGLNYLCAGFKAFFHHVDRPMRFMASSCATASPCGDRRPLRARMAARYARECQPWARRPVHLRLGTQVEALSRKGLRLTRVK